MDYEVLMGQYVNVYACVCCVVDEIVQVAARSIHSEPQCDEHGLGAMPLSWN
jgi:hypothetical protein